MPHGRHIYAKAYDMAKATMCENSQSDNALPQCKFVLRCCPKCLSINIPDQETDDKHPNPSPSISFHTLLPLSCHMGVIFTPKHMTWQRQQCVKTHSQIMRYQTGNGYLNVVPNVLELLFLTRKHMISIPTLVLQFVFIFTI